ncbi:MAG: 4Fe-4S dicluster domain-containing protein [Proteobacteria bacterium]|nr:4Fe-4S dicluster domain-containing protein [Pseudomonadota bacterium]
MAQQKATQSRGKAHPSKPRDPSGGVNPARVRGKSKRKDRDFKIDIYNAWCKACGICMAFCPTRVFTEGEDGYPQVTSPKACIGCGWCEIHCPDFAITVREKKTKANPE